MSQAAVNSLCPVHRELLWKKTLPLLKAWAARWIFEEASLNSSLQLLSVPRTSVITFPASHLGGGDTILIFTWGQLRPTDVKQPTPDPNWGSNPSSDHKLWTSLMPICLYQSRLASSVFPSAGQMLFAIESCLILRKTERPAPVVKHYKLERVSSKSSVGSPRSLDSKASQNMDFLYKETVPPCLEHTLPH